MSIGFCPRCGEKSYEVLKTHSFCINCNYYPEVEIGSFDLKTCLDQESKKTLVRWSRQLEAVM